MKKRQTALTLWIVASMMLVTILLYWLREYYCAPVYTSGVIVPQAEQVAPTASEDIPIQEEFNVTYSENKVGWLKVSGVNIDEPVLQTDNNTFYLTHDAQDKPDPFGACFALDSCNLYSMAELSRVTVLFGHSAGNTDKTGFSRLQKLKDLAFAADNRYIHLRLTDGSLSTWEVFAAGDYPVSYDYLIAEPDDNYFLWQLEEMKNRSFCTYDSVEVTERDNIIILSTCNGSEDSRFLVCGVLVE